MEDITLVIADPHDAVVARVREIMACWASAGLLRRSLWWAGERDGDHRARWSDGGAEVDLSEEVAKEPYQTIRIVAFLPVSAGQQVTCAVRRTADALRHAIRQPAAATQRICSLTLLVPATQVEGIPTASLASAWDVNLVAADEDRITSGHAAMSVRRPDDLAAHAASVLATAAGLWRGMRTAPFDGDVEGAGLQDARVRVVRSFVRAVRGHDLVASVAAEVFALAADDDWLDIALSVTPARNPHAVVRKAAEEYLAGPGALLTWTPPPAPHGCAAPLTVNARAALKTLGDLMRGRVAPYPGEVFDRNREQTARHITEFVEDCPVESATDGRPESPLGPVLKAGTAEFAEALIEWTGQEPRFADFGDTWPALRVLAFGLVDAGPLPPGCAEPHAGRTRMAVTAIDAICPDPASAPFPLPPDPVSAPSRRASDPASGAPLRLPPDPASGAPFALVPDAGGTPSPLASDPADTPSPLPTDPASAPPKDPADTTSPPLQDPADTPSLLPKDPADTPSLLPTDPASAPPKDPADAPSLLPSDAGDAPPPPPKDPADAPPPPASDPGDAPSPLASDPAGAPSPPASDPGDTPSPPAKDVGGAPLPPAPDAGGAPSPLAPDAGDTPSPLAPDPASAPSPPAPDAGDTPSPLAPDPASAPSPLAPDAGDTPSPLAPA
ncbi:MAG: hypothetical protein ACRD0K_26495, partial [Egibacteraceae bacterium]